MRIRSPRISFAHLHVSGGASLDGNTLRKVLFRAVILAFVGSALPVGFGIIYLHLILHRPLPEAVASGAALASTSVAVALVLMQQHELVETRVGTLLTAAAMIDDVFSLVLIGVVSNLGPLTNTNSSTPDEPEAQADGSPSLPIAVVRPVVASLGVLVVGAIVARLLQSAIERLWAVEIDEATSTARSSCCVCQCHRSTRDARCGKRTCRCHYCKCSIRCCHCGLGERIRRFFVSSSETRFAIFMCLYAYMWSVTAELAGSSHLIGCFAAGLAFGRSRAEETSTAFRLAQKSLAKLAPLKQYLLAVFFGSIGFDLRVSILFEPWALLYGALIYTILMFIAKLVTGVFAKPLSWSTFFVIGTAMVGRGELGLYLSEQAQQAGVMSSQVFAATSWALILNTLLSPIIFGMVLRRHPHHEMRNNVSNLNAV